MNGPSRPGIRFQRRTLIAVLVVVLAALAWSSWPQGDPRFVGTWFVHLEDRPKSEDYHLELRGGGLAKMRRMDGTIVLSQWSVSEGELVLGSQAQTLFSRLLFAALQTFTSAAFQIRVGRQTRYSIGEIRSDRVILTRARWQFGLGQRTTEQRTILTRGSR